tara:strand:- start:199 stop:444 length:246 start_codon:yes stop_codon:yes gene_type:complete
MMKLQHLLNFYKGEHKMRVLFKQDGKYAIHEMLLDDTYSRVIVDDIVNMTINTISNMLELEAGEIRHNIGGWEYELEGDAE